MGYVACPACGSKCGDELTKCWNCEAAIPPGLPPFGQVTDKLKAEMKADASRSKQMRTVMTAVAVVALVGGIAFVGTCAKSSVVQAHFHDGQVAYEHAAKGFPGAYKTMDIGTATAMFGAVLQDDPNYDEVYVYRASLDLMQYQYQLRGGPDKGDKSFLSKATDDCNTALRLIPNSADAYYYLAGVAYLTGDKTGCLSNLDKCLSGTASGPLRQQQWKDQAQPLKDYVSAQSVLDPTQLNLRPIKDMLPAWEIM